MDGKWSDQRSPAETAWILSKVFFCWMTSVFAKGCKKGIGTEDLYINRKRDSAEKLGDRLEVEWNKELAKRKSGIKPSLAKAAFRTFGPRYVLFGSLALFGECVTRSIQAILLGYVVRYYSKKGNDTCDVDLSAMPNVFDVNSSEITEMQQYYSAGGVCLAAALYVLTYHPYFYGMQETGMTLRISCSTIVYKKALKLSRGAMGQTTIGQMVNLLSNDVNKFDEAMIFIPYLVIGPLQTIVSGIILWQYLGVSCLAGISILILYVPFQGIMAKVFSKLRSKTTVLTDERIRLMNETVSGMRVIKMYTWEKPFVDLIADIRRREVNKIRWTAILRGLNISLFYVSSKLILLLAFLAYSMLESCPLSAETAFVSMTLFNSLRLTMTLYFPYGVAQGAESLISFKRLQKFLLLEEQDASNEIDASNLRPKPDQCGVWLNSLTGKWNRAVSEPTLSNITASVKPGELLAVVGSVGSGKSSFLMSVLGELPLVGGTVKVRGKVAYASQEPWVFAGDVRSNVLFGQEFDEKKYQKVLHACALDKDIEQLPYGDRTLVGERGVSLSGGQKARVNLARALYLDADIYLLDDPLSAVDAAVAKHLFEKCINGYLKTKTRILVTHQLQFLRAASHIMVLKGGNCFAYGTYHQLTKSGMDLVSLIESDRDSSGAHIHRQESNLSITRHRRPSVTSITSSTSSTGIVYESTLSLGSEYEMDPDEFKTDGKPFDDKAPTQQEEVKSSGSVSSKVYWTYIRAGAGPIFLISLVLFNILCQAVFNGSDFWLTIWTGVMSKQQNLTDCQKSGGGGVLNEISECQGTWFFVYVYAGLCGILFLFSLMRSIMFFTLCMRSSKELHNRMFSSVVRAPITFFDSNPIGRILNRFTKDMGTIDDLIPITALDMTAIFLGLIGSMVVAGVVNYFLTIPAILLVVVFYFVRKFYLFTARDLKRLEGITRSPVFSHISTSLYGLTTIRAFNAQQMFEEKFYLHQDRHTRTWYIVICATRWLGIVLDWICVLYIFVLTAVLVFNPLDDNGGNVGLAISTALFLCGSFQWGIRQSAEIENQMTSVERVSEYSELKPEANLEADPDKKPPPEWPQEGKITLDDMSLTYLPDDPPVLKNLKCTIQPMEKIGIVGRTGAGKSSMISALFRMSEPDGKVFIDGIETKSIGLHDLRSKISIIPQDPVLFTGPVRRNIDPFNKQDDKALWNVLEEVQLKDAVTLLPGGLDTFLSEGGSNFSVGQRQLICMARAILRNNRILVLDEATANVDARTDALIQETIRKKFSQCTVLTIAHRLNTIMDSDKVLVLDAGRIKEFNEPFILLQDKHGLLYDMVEKTGPAMMEKLFDIAKKTSDSKRGYLPTQKSPVMSKHSEKALQRIVSLKKSLVPISEIENRADESTENLHLSPMNGDFKPYRTDSDTGEQVFNRKDILKKNDEQNLDENEEIRMNGNSSTLEEQDSQDQTNLVNQTKAFTKTRSISDENTKNRAFLNQGFEDDNTDTNEVNNIINLLSLASADDSRDTARLEKENTTGSSSNDSGAGDVPQRNLNEDVSQKPGDQLQNDVSEKSGIDNPCYEFESADL